MLKRKDESGTSEDGLKALQELVGKYNKVTDEVIRANHGKARQHQHEGSQDPDDYFMETTLARYELEEMVNPSPIPYSRMFASRGLLWSTRTSNDVPRSYIRHRPDAKHKEAG